MFRFSTILGRFTSYTLILLVIPPLTFLVFFYTIFRNEMLNDAYDDIQDEIVHEQTALNGWIEHHEALLRLVAGSPKLIPQPDSRVQLFQIFLGTHTDFKSISFFSFLSDLLSWRLFPSIRTSLSVMVSRSTIHRNIVDFPLPEGPMRETTSPLLI